MIYTFLVPRRIMKNLRYASTALAFAVLAASGPAFPRPQDPPIPKRSYITAHVNPHVPSIDGKIDDPVWEKVEWQGDFIQREPYEGEKPTEKTAFKILFDDKALFVAIRAFDSDPARIERRVSRRDSVGGDWVDITLDSYFDRLTGFSFGVNAAGVKVDMLYTNGGMEESDQDMSWDPIWDVETAVDAEGWAAEMRIPFSQLRFGNKDEQVWGLQVTRGLFRKDETSTWQFIPRSSPGWVHMFGELRGIKGIRPPRQVEIVPYTVGKLQAFRRVPGNPFATGRDEALSGGLDGKIGVTHDLTLNFTVNPDFGQVEADPSVVNLTAFETYYEEKRPFFVEGRNILSFRLMGGDGDNSSDNLFYSRRIGRTPQNTPDIDGHIDMPGATNILGAFKLTGKTRSGLSVGVLESVTSKETASIFSDGRYRNQTVEPLTNYFGFRLQKDYNQGGTKIGGMLTATNRSLRSEEIDFLHDAAYTGGLDIFHSWRAKTYYVSLKTVFSSVHGSREAILRTQESPLRYYQRPDAGHLSLDPTRTSLSGYGGTLDFGKQGGGNLMFVAGVNWRSPGLELNDMGFLRGADEIMQYFWLGYRIRKPFSIFRRINININQWAGWNFNGESIFTGGNVNLNGEFKNYWSAGLGINRQGESLSASALRGGPMLAQPRAWNAWYSVETDLRKKVRFILAGQSYRRDNGDSLQQYWEAGVTIVPSKALSVSFEPSFSFVRQKLQYVGTFDAAGETRYIFGRIDQKELGLTVRLNYSLTPDLSVQFYGQPFIASGKYSRFKRITDPKTRDYSMRYHVFTDGEIGRDAGAGEFSVDENGDGRPDYAFQDPDFNVLEFRSNLVIRWEYIPGSAVYVVWSQGRSGFLPTGNFSFRNDVRDLFDTHPHDVVLIKFSYCFQL